MAASLIQISHGLYASNCYLLVCRSSGTGVVIDPGDPSSELREALTKTQADWSQILLTHGHWDHCVGIPMVRELLGPLPIALHPADSPLYTHTHDQARLLGVQSVSLPPVSHPLAHGDKITVGELTLDVRHTPGHSPGSVCLRLDSERLVFTGDLIFQMGVGRTDLWQGSDSQLLHSIRTEILSLPNDYRLYSGHGPVTTVGAERRNFVLNSG